MRTHGVGKEVAKDDRSGIVRSIIVNFANRSLVLDLNRTEEVGRAVLPHHFRFQREGGFLTIPVVVCITHDESFHTGISPFLLDSLLQKIYERKCKTDKLDYANGIVERRFQKSVSVLQMIFLLGANAKTAV